LLTKASLALQVKVAAADTKNAAADLVVETVAVVVMAVETVVAMAAVENQGIINHVIPYKHKSLSNERLFLCVWFK
jgi:hypothetical protein